MKTIIVVRGTEKVGKTSAIREVYKRLDSKESTLKIKIIKKPNLSKKDIEAVLEYKKERIGINSMGDPKLHYLLEKLEKLAKDNCKVILTASRTSGSTVETVKKIAKKYDYKIIWTSNFNNNTGTEKMPNGLNLNEQFAKGMIDLILKLL
jgi:thymidylate kinase